jgi:large subunit ribosomal protein L22
MERPMNTAMRDRVIHKSIEEYIDGLEKRRTPVSRVKLVRIKGENPSVNVFIHTSRPQILRPEADSIATSLKEEFGGRREIKVEVVAEARAVAKFIRTSPRKARLLIDVIKGKRLSDALAVLRFVTKIAAEPISKVLRSAAANALDGWGALPEELQIANIIADGGPILKRVRARAQGRAYRIAKRTTHLTVVLTEMPAPVQKKRPQGKVKAKPTPITTIIKPKAVAKTAAAKAAVEETAPEVEQTAVVEETAPAAETIETAPVQEETPAEETSVTAESASAAETPENEPEADAVPTTEGEG